MQAMTRTREGYGDGVGKAGKDRPQIAVARSVGNERFAEIEARLLGEEAEARLDAGRCHVGMHVEGDEGKGREDRKADADIGERNGRARLGRTVVRGVRRGQLPVHGALRSWFRQVGRNGRPMPSALRSPARSRCWRHVL